MGEKSDILSINLPNSETLNNLTEYNYLLTTIFIQKLKSLTTFGGYTNVVCVNALRRIQLSDEICTIINSIIIKLPGFGVYCGIIISKLLLKLWAEPLCEYDVNELSNELMKLQDMLERSLASMKVECKTVNIKFLQSLVIPLLLEEPSICLGKDGLNNLSLSIVKAVLSATGEDLSLSYINIVTEQGDNDFFVTSGLMFEVDDICLRQLQSDSLHQSTLSKIVLFSDHLEPSPVLIEELVKNDVGVVVCQKRISDMGKLILRRQRIIPIERVGEDTLACLEALTGAVPLRYVSRLDLTQFPSVSGSFSEMRVVEKGNKSFVSIVAHGKSVATLYVCCRSFNDSSVIREVVNNALRLVRSALSSPFYLPGPVSFESVLSSNLKENFAVAPVLGKIIVIFIDILEEISGLYCKSFLRNDYLDSYCLKRNAILQSLNAVMNMLNLGRIVRRI